MRRQLFLCPLQGTTMFQIQGPVPMEGDVDLSAAGLTEMVTARSRRSDIVIREVRWASAFQMNARLADKYRVGRAFLCGDSAHVHPPTGGQGLNTSIQDAYNLGWKLAAVVRGADQSLLDTYEEERRPIAQDMLGFTTRLLEALKERGDMRRGREGQQLDLGYAGSSIGLNAPAREGRLLAAGDRAPDAPLMGRAGQAVRLFELLKGPHWTLIGFSTQKSRTLPARKNLRLHRIADDGDVSDADKVFQPTYGVSPGDWVLVRPDGYVGAIVNEADFSHLEAYMVRMGLGA